MPSSELIAAIARSPFASLAILVLLAEAVASTLSPVRNLPNASETIRNPLSSNFGWPEYLSGNTPSGKRLVVIVSNSQGRSAETPPDKIYPKLLKSRLEAQHPEIVVENWSIPGLRAVEADLLAIRATERRAVLVVFLVNQAIIESPKDLDLGYPESDTSLLMGNPRRWHKVANSSFSDNTSINTLLQKGAERYSNLVRSRQFLHRFLERRRPNHWGTMVYSEYGQRRITAARKRRDRLARLSGKPTQAQAPANPFPNTRRRQDYSGLAIATRAIHHTLSRAGAEGLWIWQPLPGYAHAAGRNKEGSAVFFARGRRPLARASAVVRESGLTPVDMRDYLADDHFREGRGAQERGTHFTIDGHQHMADLLLPIISRELQ